MSTQGRWSVASAKAQLSRVLDDAQREPQVIERRGQVVAVVVAPHQFEDLQARARWKRFLEISQQIRAEGGGEIRVPRRSSRRSPLPRS